jgi:hypothetical protein
LTVKKEDIKMEVYESPKMEVIEFDSEDVITSSGCGNTYDENRVFTGGTP